MRDFNKLTLRPKDYIVLSGGLKIENISLNDIIEFKLPTEYKLYPVKLENRVAG